VPLLALFAVRARDLWRERRTALRSLLPAGLACAAVTAAVFVPYLLAPGHPERSEREIRTFGASPLSYLTPSDRNLYGDVWPAAARRPENSLFFGIAATGLALLAAWRGLRARRMPDPAPPPPWERGLLLGGAACVLLSFPIFYLPLMKVVPGLSGMRVPARFAALAAFPVVFFAARELDRRLGGSRAAAALVAVLLFFDLAPRRIDWLPLPPESRFPAVYHWLARRTDVDGVLELPLLGPARDISAMYFATLHWKPLVNGYSGYIPDRYGYLVRDCCDPIPDPQQLAQLRLWGVTHVLVHKNDFPARWERRWLRRWALEPGIAIEYEDAADLVYRIQGSGGTAIR
jgi:hypothetical protein